MGSELAEFLFAQARLAHDGEEGPVGNVSRVHGHVGLPTIGMTQHNMRTGLAFHDKACALQFCQKLAGLVRHDSGHIDSGKQQLGRSRQGFAVGFFLIQP